MTSSQAGGMAVIGNGVIGHGVAEVFAKAGWAVSLIGRSEGSLAQAREKIRASLDEFVQADLLKAAEVETALANILVSTDLSAAASADLVIEAVPEDMALKIDIFAKLDTLCRPDAILATSSGHPASEVDGKVARKERVIAAHFWYPPQLLPLVEVCGSPATSKAVIARTCEILAGVGKTPVVVDREVDGFIGNRIQFAALREAWSLWANGVASAEAIDTVVKHSIGRRLGVTGPIESADLGGLDVMVPFAAFLNPSLDTAPQPPEQVAALPRAGHRGVSSGKGVYDWRQRDGAGLLKARRQELLRWLKIDQQKP